MVASHNRNIMPLLHVHVAWLSWLVLTRSCLAHRRAPGIEPPQSETSQFYRWKATTWVLCHNSRNGRDFQPRSFSPHCHTAHQTLSCEDTGSTEQHLRR
ncbi:hypothetical protein B0T22DRAFT_45428 [Podospora appendiculata]|uniref:Secreted protein n=1 Tax=Podospora appendiculata TaxID=314037 RepID=A0AAE1CGM0_9PEZI|nr:hypothetical protein B0T22DRAFT_45428 [Podospora appendiculata]